MSGSGACEYRAEGCGLPGGCGRLFVRQVFVPRSGQLRRAAPPARLLGEPRSLLDGAGSSEPVRGQVQRAGLSADTDRLC